jgi:uncharacterized membrane protein
MAAKTMNLTILLWFFFGGLLQVIFLYGNQYHFLRQDPQSKIIRSVCLVVSAPVWLPAFFIVVGFVAVIKKRNPIKCWFVHNNCNLTLQTSIRQYIDGVL